MTIVGPDLVVSSLDNVDSIVVEIHHLYKLYWVSILALTPNLVFLVGTVYVRSIVDHPAIVSSEAVPI